MRTVYASISPVDKETAAFVMKCQYLPHAQASVNVAPHPDSPETYVFNYRHDEGPEQNPDRTQQGRQPPVVKTGLSAARAREEARRLLEVSLSGALDTEVEIVLRDRAA